MGDEPGEVAELRARVQQYEEFIEYLPDALLEVDLRSFRVTRMNRMATVLTGYGNEAVTAGLVATDLLDASEVARVLAAHREHAGASVTTGAPYRRSGTQDLYEVTMRRRDGQRFPAEGEGSYVLDHEGVPASIRFLFRDISARRAAEQELRHALACVRTPRGALPVCSGCRQVSTEGGWVSFEAFLRDNSDGEPFAALCPDCSRHQEGGG